MHLTAVDLNLLVVLRELLRARNTTIAARRLGRTQSAVSHALQRLRVLLDDKLFVRVGGGLRPTAAAEALAPAVTYPYDDGPDPQFPPSPAARVARYESKSTTALGFGGGFHRCGRSAAISSTPVTLSILARTSARYSTGFTPARVHETTSE